ncbi:MAG: prepilin-type N-terminal cleavage/methylation domain-containing protein [Rhizobacter sp.]|nr:prepilin-type N-terminal cleavage/methylation domain-containing protein [Rhizobacter sp.]
MNTRPRSPLASRGFTLVEVLVAMFIMAILAVMAWQGVDGIVNTRTASQAKLEQLLRLNTVLAQFEQDLQASQDTGAIPQPMPSFDGLSLRITRRTPDGMQLVVWSLRGGTWLRWAGPAVTTVRALQEQWMNSQQFIGNEPGQLRTITGISDWQAYCYRNNAWSNCQSSAGSVTGTPPTTPAAPARPVTDPLRAMRVVLSFAEGSGFSGSVTRNIALRP